MDYSTSTGPQPPIPPPETTLPSAKYEKYEAQRELAKAISGSNETLAEATTVFPFTLFPDTVTIDRTQITITHRSFFAVGDVSSIRIEDVLNVDANVGPFFGSLKVHTRVYSQHNKPYKINWLWRNDALRIKRILHGYLIATKKQIDCSSLGTKELAIMLDELGKETGGARTV
jgi:hypothetical protein